MPKSPTVSVNPSSPPTPPGLPYLQWKGYVHDENQPIHKNIDDCLHDIEKTLLAYNLNIDQYWPQFMPLCIPLEKEKWLKQFIEEQGVSASWDTFKKKFKAHFEIADAKFKGIAIRKLCKIKKGPKESMVDFVDRFRSVVSRSPVRDKQVLISCFKFALSKDYQRRLFGMIESMVDPEKKYSIAVVCELAIFMDRLDRNIFPVLDPERELLTDKTFLDLTAPTKREHGSGNMQGLYSAFIKQEMIAPANEDEGKKAKTGKFCAFHRATTHNTEECRGLRALFSKQE